MIFNFSNRFGALHHVGSKRLARNDLDAVTGAVFPEYLK